MAGGIPLIVKCMSCMQWMPRSDVYLPTRKDEPVPPCSHGKVEIEICGRCGHAEHLHKGGPGDLKGCVICNMTARPDRPPAPCCARMLKMATMTAMMVIAVETAARGGGGPVF